MTDLFNEPIIPKISTRLRLGTMLLDHAFICILLIPFVFIFKNQIYPDIQGSEYSKYLYAPISVIYLCKDSIHGRSLAKRTLKLTVVDFRSHKEASPIQTVIRNSLIFVWPIEVIVSFFNQERRIGDFFAGTRLTFNYDPKITAHKIKLWEMTAAILIAILITWLVLLFF